jgi:hypothetical protein
MYLLQSFYVGFFISIFSTFYDNLQQSIYRKAWFETW